MENKLVFFNTGTIEMNKAIFSQAIEQEFGITDMEEVVSGYKFVFDNETGGEIRVRFLNDGVQLWTEINGNYAWEVVEVYKAFSMKFYDEEEVCS